MVNKLCAKPCSYRDEVVTHTHTHTPEDYYNPLPM